MADADKKGQLTPGKEEGRKPYSKPCLVSEPIYETLALACGKLPGQ